MKGGVRGEVLQAGEATGEVVRLEAPLSFWGGFDPASGTVIDRHHPQHGLGIAGRVLVLPASRGSAGTPAGVAESLRRGKGPVAIVLGTVDVNVAVGALVAERLYGIAIPVVAVTAASLGWFESGRRVRVDRAGAITALEG